MKKTTLKEFVEITDVQIREPEEIHRILKDMWNLPFGNLFHSSWEEHGTDPSGYIQGCLADEHIIPDDDSNVKDLKYGEVALLIKEEIDKQPEERKKKEFNNILIQLGRMYCTGRG